MGVKKIPTLGLILAILFFIAGVLGVFLPMLPGVPLVFLGTIIYGLLSGFPGGLGPRFYLGQGALTVLAVISEYLLGIWGTKKYGGSGLAVKGGVFGALLGTVLFGPLGFFFGSFLGAALGGLISSEDFHRAVSIGYGTTMGFLLGMLAKLALAAAMIIWFFLVI